MKTYILTFLILGIFIAIIEAHGAESTQKNIDETCNSPASPDIYECVDNQRKIEDDALNNLYKQLRQKIEKGSTAEKKLIEAQKAWIVFRDTDCEFESDGNGGFRRGIIIVVCLKDKTKKRADELRGYLRQYNH